MIKLFDSGAELIIDRLEKLGYQAYYVGGCVRDAVMGHSINDYDITTNCMPETVTQIFSDFSIFTAGLKHGTVSVVINQTVYEITTFRIDGDYFDNRRPESVKFCNNLLDDLARRDFTCNALAFNKNQGIIDYFGGFYDIQNNIIKAVGCAKKRFNEDALRILRMVRFCSKLNFIVEENTKIEAIKNAYLLSNISKERIWVELKGILLGKNSYFALTEFKRVIECIIPEFNRVSDKDYFNLANAISNAVSLNSKLAIFLSSFDFDEVENILRLLKCDKKTIFAINTLLKNKNVRFDLKIQIKSLMNAMHEYIYDFFDLQKAYAIANKNECKVKLIEHSIKIVNEIIDKKECYSLKQLKINGNDLISFGYQDKRIGQILNFLLQAVIEEKINNNKDELFLYLRNNFYD